LDLQIIVNILISFSNYLLISLSFSIIYLTTKFFNFAHAVIITLGAYFTYLYFQQIHANFILAILLAITSSVIVSLLFEMLIFKPLRNTNANSFNLLISSIGLNIVVQNIISMIWGDDTRIIMQDASSNIQMFGLYTTIIQITTLILALLIYMFMVFFIYKTNYGNKILATSSNPKLSLIFGINTNNIIIVTIIIGSAIAALTGILVSINTYVTPFIGLDILLYGIISMIIGGIGNIKGTIWGALLLSVSQHFAAFYIGSQWIDTVAYIILIVFLILKPLGFSGNRLKKIEV
jgi:branched-chain amino acid transport system permease protein